MIDQVDSFTHLGSCIRKDDGSNEDVKSRIAKTWGVFSQLKKVCKNRKIGVQTKIRILEATVMTVVKYGSESWVLQKEDKDLLDVSQRNCLRIVLGTRLTAVVQILLSDSIMRERSKGLGHVLLMKDDRLSKIGLSANRLGLNGKQTVHSWGGRLS